MTAVICAVRKELPVAGQGHDASAAGITMQSSRWLSGGPDAAGVVARQGVAVQAAAGVVVATVDVLIQVLTAQVVLA